MRAIASVVAALVVVAALGWMVLRDRQAVVQDATPSERSAAQAATEESESRAAPVPSPSTPSNVDRPTRQPDGPPVTGRANADPLPPLDEPFAQHLDALRGIAVLAGMRERGRRYGFMAPRGVARCRRWLPRGSSPPMRARAM